MRLLVGLILLLNSVAQGQVLMHSHNDYNQTRPLETALLSHFNSVEADVTEFENQLIVSHDTKDLSEKPTLEDLYLKPLTKDFCEHSSLKFLFIDIKKRQLGTLNLLHDLISKYEVLFLRRGESLKKNKIQIIISGDVDRKSLVESDTYPYFFVDGRLADLNLDIDSAVMPIISANFQLVERWRKGEKLSNNQKEKLKTLVKHIHQENKKLRFWNTRDETIFWQLLKDIGVDIIGTDHIDELNQFIE